MSTIGDYMGLPSKGLVVHRNSPTKFVEDTSVEPTSRHQENPRLRTSKGDGYVEVMHAGWFVELPVALNLSLWKDSGVVYNDPRKPRGRYAREHMLKELAKGLNSLRDVDNDLVSKQSALSCYLWAVARRFAMLHLANVS